MTGNEIREKFLQYFEANGHRRVRSSSLVPVGDPTLLFTNAGMNQFKDVFLGLEQREYKRATTAQKCVRAGGKHNDLENVGRTARHHTFFEMLGNFSFGDYFKKDAIAFAWELVTSPKWFGIPKDRLYATIFKGEEGIPRDAEAYEHWIKQGVPKDRIYEFGLQENFWAMGDVGPCGPCSEIHYDMGPSASDEGHADCPFGCECGRYVEIWNLVFMQFNRDASGKLAPLPKPSIDTGAGLERFAATLLNLKDPKNFSNYDTDLLHPLIAFASELCGKPYGEAKETDTSLRILADHSRAAAFLVSDGVLPSNEGRGYVLRKIIRRAVDHGRPMGLEKPFLFEMAGQVADLMREPYPELLESIGKVAKVIREEEEKYAHLIEPALQRFEKHIEARKEAIVAAAIAKAVLEETKRVIGTELPTSTKNQILSLFVDLAQTGKEWIREIRQLRSGDVEATLGMTRSLDVVVSYFQKVIKDSPSLEDRVKNDVIRAISSSGNQLLASFEQVKPIITGEHLFFAYDTLGLRPDFIRDVAARHGWVIPEGAGSEFEEELEKQRECAKASWKGVHKQVASPIYVKLAETFHTELDYYYGSHARDCHIEAIITKDGEVKEIEPGTEAEIVLDRTVFYAEAGGQVSDVGTFYDNTQTVPVAEVRGAYYPVAGLIAHRVVARETLRVGDRVAAVADGARREHTKRNHTATHLMHAALRDILGPHVKQAGSLVAPDHLRFDFSHFTSLDENELCEIEQQVNAEILRNAEVQTDVTSLDNALASGALAFFGDKYPELNVRVVTISDPAASRGFYSKELCGGTHVRRTGDIGIFKIVAEQSVAAGVRRIEAITGARALEDYQKSLGILRQLAAALNVGEEELPAAIERLTQAGKLMEKQLDALKRKGALSKVDELLGQVRTVKDVRVLSAQVTDMDREAMRQLVDTLRQKLGSGVVVLGMAENGKVALISGVTRDLTGRLHAGKIVQAVAREVGGSGGGRPDLAEAGGKDTSALEKAIEGVYSLVEQML